MGTTKNTIINAKVGSRYLYGAVLFPNIFKINPSYSKENLKFLKGRAENPTRPSEINLFTGFVKITLPILQHCVTFQIAFQI